MTHNSQTAQQQSAVIAVAQAYLARGPAIQYDQLSMDRLLRITPRRNRFAPPEAASSRPNMPASGRWRLSGFCAPRLA